MCSVVCASECMLLELNDTDQLGSPASIRMLRLALPRCPVTLYSSSFGHRVGVVYVEKLHQSRCHAEYNFIVKVSWNDPT